MAQSLFDLNSTRYGLIVDIGIGPNFMKANGFQEYSLNGISQPDAPFPGHTTTTFSVTAGAGIKLNHGIDSIPPLTCGYRFFYLGQGQFNNNSGQLNSFKTGETYANALLCSVSI